MRVIIGISIAVIFGIALYLGTVNNMETAWEIITPEALEKSLPPKDFTLIDVRQPEEYKEGHIPGAILIPLDKLEDELTRLDINKEAIVYCFAGNRSARAAAILSNYGFKKIKNLTAGIKGWKGKVEK